MVTVQVINHGGCHQGLHVLGESLNTHQILDVSKANVNQCCKNRKSCTLQSDFGTTFYPFEECFSTWLNEKWSREVLSPVWQQRNTLITANVLAWLKWTVLHSGVTQIKAVPSPCLGTRDPNCIYSNFVCRQKSLGLLFSDFLCNFRGAVVQPNWQSCTMQPLALSSHPGASKTEHCATKERKSLSQPKPDQEGRQIMVIFGDMLFCGIKDEIPLSWCE